VRVLRSVVSADVLTLTIGGRAGDVPMYTGRQAEDAFGLGLEILPMTAPGAGPGARPAFVARVTFDGTAAQSGYVRQEIVAPLR